MLLPAHRRLFQARAIGPLLDARELRQAGLAALLGVGRPLVAQWMAGKVVLSAYWVIRIGIVLDLSDAEVRALLAAAAYCTWQRRAGRGGDLVDPLIPSTGNVVPRR